MRGNFNAGYRVALKVMTEESFKILRQNRYCNHHHLGAIAKSRETEIQKVKRGFNQIRLGVHLH